MDTQNTTGWNGRGKLETLVDELNRQKATKVDFVADTRELKIEAVPGEGSGGLLLTPTRANVDVPSRTAEWLPKLGMPIKLQALEQVGSKSNPEVPTKFLQRMVAQEPVLLAKLLDGLLQHNPSRRFIRCLDGQVRSFHSDRYRVLDHYDTAFAALDAVRSVGGEVIEAQLSDKHMRIKFTTRALWDVLDQSAKAGKSIPRGALANSDYLRDIGYKGGDSLPGGAGTIFPLVTVSNSETGHGGLSVQLGIFEGACINGMIYEDAVSRVHLGERLEVGGFSADTLTQESKAIYMKARDAIRMAFTKEGFAKIVSVAKGAQMDVVAAPQSAVQNVAKAAGLSDTAKDALLGYFIKDYDMNRLGLAQATARLAQDQRDAERAHELEETAGRVLRKKVAIA